MNIRNIDSRVLYTAIAPTPPEVGVRPAEWFTCFSRAESDIRSHALNFIARELKGPVFLLSERTFQEFAREEGGEGERSIFEQSWAGLFYSRITIDRLKLLCDAFEQSEHLDFREKRFNMSTSEFYGHVFDVLQANKEIYQNYDLG